MGEIGSSAERGPEVTSFMGAGPPAVAPMQVGARGSASQPPCRLSARCGHDSGCWNRDAGQCRMQTDGGWLSIPSRRLTPCSSSSDVT